MAAFFQPLNPYSIDLPVFKVEKAKENVWFYGISSRRYALYHYDEGKIRFIDDPHSYMLHGLGHLANPFPRGSEDWHGDLWMDILNLHYGHITSLDIEQKYATMFAISRLTVTTPVVWGRFKSLNEGKAWRNQIKPFNFCLVGFQTVAENGKAVKPLAPYSKNSQKIVH